MLHLCEKAKILHKERKKKDLMLMLRWLRCIVLCVSVSCPRELIYVLGVWSPAAVLLW